MAKGQRHIVADAPRMARLGTKKFDCDCEPRRRRDGEKVVVVVNAADDGGTPVVAGEARRLQKGSHDACRGRASEEVPAEQGVDSRWSWWVELARQPCRPKAVERCGRKEVPKVSFK